MPFLKLSVAATELGTISEDRVDVNAGLMKSSKYDDLIYRT